MRRQPAFWSSVCIRAPVMKAKIRKGRVRIISAQLGKNNVIRHVSGAGRHMVEQLLDARRGDDGG